MSHDTTGLPELTAADNLRPWEAAQYLGLSESTLAKLRMRASRNDGPRFVKLGRSVIYRRSDLHHWLEKNTVSN